MTGFELMAAGAVLGAVHAFEADHMAAVSAFVSRDPRGKAAMGHGLRWAAGHGAAVLLVGALLAVLGGTWLTPTSAVTERLVGLAMVVLGLWTMNGARRASLERHRRNPGHAHPHDMTAAGRRGHGLVGGVGLLHGLAGAAPVLALLPVAASDMSYGMLLYLLFFAIGTAVAMALYALFAGWLLQVGSRHGELVVRAAMNLAGLASLSVGLIWLMRS